MLFALRDALLLSTNGLFARRDAVLLRTNGSSGLFILRRAQDERGETKRRICSHRERCEALRIPTVRPEEARQPAPSRRANIFAIRASRRAAPQHERFIRASRRSAPQHERFIRASRRAAPQHERFVRCAPQHERFGTNLTAVAHPGCSSFDRLRTNGGNRGEGLLALRTLRSTSHSNRSS